MNPFRYIRQQWKNIDLYFRAKKLKPGSYMEDCNYKAKRIVAVTGEKWGWDILPSDYDVEYEDPFRPSGDDNRGSCSLTSCAPHPLTDEHAFLLLNVETLFGEAATNLTFGGSALITPDKVLAVVDDVEQFINNWRTPEEVVAAHYCGITSTS